MEEIEVPAGQELEPIAGLDVLKEALPLQRPTATLGLAPTGAHDEPGLKQPTSEDAP